MPPPGVGAHAIEPPGGRPVQVGFGKAGIGIADGDIAGPTVDNIIRDGPSGCFFKGFDHLQNAVPPARAKIVSSAVRLLNLFQGLQMAPREIYNMDVVPDTRPVGRVVVIPEDPEAGEFADGDLADVGHEVVGDIGGVFAHQAAFVGPHGIEIAQEDDLPGGIGNPEIPKDLLDHQLGAAVGIGGGKGKFLPYRNCSWIAVNSCGRTEDDPLDPTGSHHLAEGNRRADVVVIVIQGSGNRFTHCLETGKMNYGVAGMGGENGLQSGAVPAVNMVKDGSTARNGINAVKDADLAVGEVIRNYDIIAGLQKLHAGVTADVAGAAGDKYCFHDISLSINTTHIAQLQKYPKGQGRACL